MRNWYKLRRVLIFLKLLSSAVIAEKFFTIVQIPDTQKYTVEGYASERWKKFHGMMEWIVEHKDSLNIVFVSHVGDLVESTNRDEREWIVASDAIKKLEDADIPYGIATGNHDNGSLSTPELTLPRGSLHFWNKYFPASRFEKYPWYGGSCDESTAHHYQVFTGTPGLDFIFFHRGIGESRCNGEQRDEWMAGVLEKYPNH